MIKFPSFRDAINYRKFCPVCKKRLQINDRDLATDYGYEFRGNGSETLSFYLDQSQTDTLTINLDTEACEISYSERIDEDYGYPGGMGNVTTGRTFYAKKASPRTYNGMLIHALTINCNSCCQYGYTLQIHFDLAVKKLSFALLDSEHITIEDGSSVHEIKNSYAMTKTRYRSFEKGGSAKAIELPLLPLDLKNPQEMVGRIRKLLVFS